MTAFAESQARRFIPNFRLSSTPPRHSEMMTMPANDKQHASSAVETNPVPESVRITRDITSLRSTIDLYSQYALTDDKKYPDNLSQAVWRLWAANGSYTQVRQDLIDQYGEELVMDAERVLALSKSTSEKDPSYEDPPNSMEALKLAKQTVVLIREMPESLREELERKLGIVDVASHLDSIFHPDLFNTAKIETIQELVTIVIAIAATMGLKEISADGNLPHFIFNLDLAFYSFVVASALSHARTLRAIGRSTNWFTNKMDAVAGTIMPKQNSIMRDRLQSVVRAAASGLAGTVAVESVKEGFYHAVPFANRAIHEVFPNVPEYIGETFFYYLTITGIGMLCLRIAQNEWMIYKVGQYEKSQNSQDQSDGGFSLDEFAQGFYQAVAPGLSTISKAKDYYDLA